MSILTRLTGYYTIAQSIYETTAPRGGITLHYKFKIGYKIYSLDKQINYRHGPPSGTYFLIRYFKPLPYYNVFLFDEAVPDCFEYGKSFETLSCDSETPKTLD